MSKLRIPVPVFLLLAILSSCAFAQETGTPAFPQVDSLLLRYEAGHPGNHLHQHEAIFGPGDVDLENHLLHNNGISFPQPRPSVTSGGVRPNLVPVYVEETTGNGRLPAPLQKDTPYYALDAADGNGLVLYPLGTDAHADITWIGDGRHRVAEADLALQDVGRIRYTDTGSGTFRLYTKVTVSRLADAVQDTIHLTASGVGGIGREFEQVIEDGIPFIYHRGAIASLVSMNDHSYHGKFMSPTGDQQAIKEKFAGNNTLYQIFVGKIPVYRRRYKSKSFLLGPEADGGVNVEDHTLSISSTRGLSTPELVRVYAGERGRIPAGLQSDTPMAARILEKGRVALHATPEDAETDTNRISFTDAGEGIWSLVFTQRVADSPKNEYIGLDVSRPDYFNTHDLVLQLKNTAASGFHGKILPRWVKTGPRAAIRKEVAGGLQVVAWAPRDTVLPSYQASDRRWQPGEPEPELTPGRIRHEGVYYTSRSANASSPYIRLHLTRAQAEASDGLPGNDPRVIHNALQFTSSGEGEWTLYPDEAANQSTFNVSGQGNISEASPVITGDELAVYVFAMDRNGEEETYRVYYFAQNPGAADLSAYHRFESTIPKEAFGPATDRSDVVLLGNSAQAHVPGRFKMHAVLLGTDGPDGRLPMKDIQRIVMHYFEKLGLP